MIDYGATPTAQAIVTVGGQAGITATSRVRVWFAGNSMSDNDADAHIMAGALVRLTPSQPVADDGFSIYATNIGGLATGTFRVSWIWSA